MSKESRQRLREEKAAVQQSKMSRRDWIRNGSIALVTIGAGTYASYLIGEARLQKYAFLKIPFNEKTELVSAEETARMIRNSVPLDMETPVQEGTDDYISIMRDTEIHMSNTLRANGIPPGKFKTRITVQTFGEPAELHYSEPAKRYCARAIEFMRGRISGLEKLDISWQVLERGQDFRENNQGFGFIGKGVRELQRIYVFDDKGINPLGVKPATIRAVDSPGAFAAKVVDSRDDKIESWYIFISANETAIHTPFAEYLPLVVTKSTTSAIREGKLSRLESEKAEEALTEGIAHHLALGLSYVDNIPRGKRCAARALENLSGFPRYQYVKPSVRWIGKNGVQKAYDLYMENPEKFVEEISRK